MESIYAGTDELFASLLSSRLNSLGMDHEYLVAKPRPGTEAIKALHVVRVENALWSRALDISGAVLEQMQERASRELDAARTFAALQANKRGRLEIAALLFLLAGALVGFLAHPYVNKPPVCPWAPVISVP